MAAACRPTPSELAAERTPRQALIAALFAAIPTGSFYGFALYSAALKSQFNLSQVDLDNLNTIPYLLGIFGPLWGWCAQQLGPKLGLAVGGGMVGAMQLLTYVLATHPLSVPAPSITLVVVTCVQYCTMSFVSSIAFSTPVVHYQHRRGEAVALVKSFVGLGGAASAQLFILFFGDATTLPVESTLNALVMWAGMVWASTAFAVALMPAAQAPAAEEPRALLRVLFYLILLLGLSLIAISLLPHGTTHRCLVPIIILLALAPIPITLGWCSCTGQGMGSPLRECSLEGGTEGDGGDGMALSGLGGDETAAAANDRKGSPLTSADAPIPAASVPAVHDDATAGILESPVAYRLPHMLQTPDAWLLWVVGTGVMGGGMLVATNLAQVVQSAGASAGLDTTLVTLFGAGNMLGRLTSMALSNRIVRRGHSRAWGVVVICSMMSLAQLGFLAASVAQAATAGQAFLFVGSAATGGLSFGAIWPHLVVCVSELFGSAHLAVNYMLFDGGCAAVGIYFLGNKLPAAFYEPAGAAHSTACLGSSCYGPSFAIVAALNGVGVLAAALVAQRSGELYRQIGRTLQRREGHAPLAATDSCRRAIHDIRT